jgi:hypothetical protein
MDYSDMYNKQVNDLIAWFSEKVAEMPLLEMSREEYRSGVDELSGEWKKLTNAAEREWRETRKYELSYNQMSTAFFRAVRAANKLKITG